MFNFFDEIKACVKNLDIKNKYNIVNISSRIVYIEGHKGLIKLSKEEVILTLKHGSIKVVGKDLILQELYDDCVKISGKIEKTEVGDA